MKHDWSYQCLSGLLLLYLDGLGAALFGVVAVDKVLGLQLSAPVAVIMGVLTSIGGGLARDVLAGRTTLLMSREIYATPISCWAVRCLSCCDASRPTLPSAACSRSPSSSVFVPSPSIGIWKCRRG